MTMPVVRGASVLGLPELKARPSSPATSSVPPRSIEDRVSLSSEARAPVPERLRALAQQAHKDPELAKQLAHGYSKIPMDVGIDGSSLPIRYIATGEVCTPEKDALYAKQAVELRDASSTLYASEKSKGTSDADILDQLFALTASQPLEFRDLIGWVDK